MKYSSIMLLHHLNNYWKMFLKRSLFCRTDEIMFYYFCVQRIHIDSQFSECGETSPTKE